MAVFSDNNLVYRTQRGGGHLRVLCSCTNMDSAAIESASQPTELCLYEFTTPGLVSPDAGGGRAPCVSYATERPIIPREGGLGGNVLLSTLPPTTSTNWECVLMNSSPHTPTLSTHSHHLHPHGSVVMNFSLHTLPPTYTLWGVS